MLKLGIERFSQIPNYQMLVPQNKVDALLEALSQSALCKNFFR